MPEYPNTLNEWLTTTYKYYDGEILSYGHVIRARFLCALAHRGQIRWNGDPYWIHPERVSSLANSGVVALVNNGTISQDELIVLRIAALLHDAVEDTDLTLENIEYIFGPAVKDIVDVLTRRQDPDGGPEPYLHSYMPRIVQHKLAVHVKRADLIDNLSDLPIGHKLAPRYIRALEMVMGGN